jgi:hypothetical protein
MAKQCLQWGNEAGISRQSREWQMRGRVMALRRRVPGYVGASRPRGRECMSRSLFAAGLRRAASGGSHHNPRAARRRGGARRSPGQTRRYLCRPASRAAPGGAPRARQESRVGGGAPRRATRRGKGWAYLGAGCKREKRLACRRGVGRFLQGEHRCGERARVLCRKSAAMHRTAGLAAQMRVIAAAARLAAVPQAGWQRKGQAGVECAARGAWLPQTD